MFLLISDKEFVEEESGFFVIRLKISLGGITW